jgi:hypothetical protein
LGREAEAEEGRMKPGDRVIHTQQPEWGVGEVLPDSAGGKVRVYFVYAGAKILKKTQLVDIPFGCNGSQRFFATRSPRSNRAT